MTIASILYTIPPYRGKTPYIRNMQYIGNGEWWALLNWWNFSGSVNDTGYWPLIYSSKTGYGLFAYVGTPIYPSSGVLADSYNADLAIIMVWSEGSGSYNNFGWYKTVDLNLGNPPWHATDIYATEYNFSNRYANGYLFYDGEFGIRAFEPSTGADVEWSGTDIQSCNPSFMPFGASGIIAAGYTSSSGPYYTYYWRDGASILTPEILKTYAIEPFSQYGLGESGLAVMYPDASSNYFMDWFLNGRLAVDNWPVPGGVYADYLCHGDGYIIGSSGNIYDMIDYRVIGTYDTSIISSASYYLIHGGRYCNYQGGSTGNQFALFDLPPLPPLIPAFSELYRSYAYNYARGVPVNAQPKNLILPKNRNIIL